MEGSGEYALVADSAGPGLKLSDSAPGSRVRLDLHDCLGMGHATDWRKHMPKARPDHLLKLSHFAVGCRAAPNPGGTGRNLGFSVGAPRVV